MKLRYIALLAFIQMIVCLVHYYREGQWFYIPQIIFLALIFVRFIYMEFKRGWS